MTQKLSDFIRDCINQLKQAGIDNPDFDVRLLVGHALKLDRTRLLSDANRILDAQDLKSLEALITRRAAREPVARILGEREFWSLPFGLNEATLEPRPDSETLIEAVLKKLILKREPLNSSPLAGEVGWGGATQSSSPNLQNKHEESLMPPPLTPSARGGESHRSLRILDLGTGTGCLLLALLHELPEATGLGVDIASRAVEQAQKNAKQLGLDNRALFVTGNWVDNIAERFDVIISNPPYIAQKDLAGLMPEVRNHDPHLALDGGEDGTTAYRFLIPHLPQRLKPNGLVVFEVGQGQADIVAGLLKKAGFESITAHQDLSGIERCVSAHIP